MELAPADSPLGADLARISAHLVDELGQKLEQQRLIVQSSICLHLAVSTPVRQRLHGTPDQPSERAQPVITGNVKAQAVLVLRHAVSRDVDAGKIGRTVTKLA